jgi:phosphate transport system substrate-binding protein
MHKTQDKPQNAKEVLAFFDWAYKNGDAAAASLDYVTLPAPVKAMMRKQWVDQIKGADGKAVYAAK